MTGESIKVDPPGVTAEQIKAEMLRRKVARGRCVAYFRDHELERIPAHDLAQMFGYGGWRTRVDEARRLVFQPEGGSLVNELDYCTIDGQRACLSYYIYRPFRALGPDANTVRPPADQAVQLSLLAQRAEP